MVKKYLARLLHKKYSELHGQHERIELFSRTLHRSHFPPSAEAGIMNHQPMERGHTSSSIPRRKCPHAYLSLSYTQLKRYRFPVPHGPGFSWVKTHGKPPSPPAKLLSKNPGKTLHYLFPFHAGFFNITPWL